MDGSAGPSFSSIAAEAAEYVPAPTERRREEWTWDSLHLLGPKSLPVKAEITF